MNENKITLTDDFNIFNLIRNLWKDRILFISIVSLFAIGSIIYSLTADQIYQVVSIIKPSDPSEETTLNEASPIIGLSLGGYSHDPVINNILITLKSETFLEIFYNKYKNDKRLFKPMPDGKEADENMRRYAAMKKLHKVIDFQVNSDHNTIALSVKLEDKIFAYEFMKDFIETLKNYISNQNIEEMEADFAYYNDLLERSSDPLIRQMLEKKITEKMSKKYKLSSNVFRVVQEPVVPAKRVSPKRTFIVILTTAVGTLFALMLISLKPVAVKTVNMLKETSN